MGNNSKPSTMADNEIRSRRPYMDKFGQVYKSRGIRFNLEDSYPIAVNLTKIMIRMTI